MKDFEELNHHEDESGSENSGPSFLAGKNPPREGLLVSKVYKCLNDPELDKAVRDYEALSNDEKRIFNLSVDKKIRAFHRKQKNQNREVHLDLAIHSKDPNHDGFQAYLEQVTSELEKKGLWKEESSEVLESDLFPSASESDLEFDSRQNPKSLTSIYKKKNELKLSLEMTASQDFSPQEAGLEWSENGSVYEHFDWPKLSSPTSHLLMRRNPWSLEEKVARMMIEGNFLNEYDFESLYPCAYFFSKSIFDRYSFIRIKNEAFRKTPLQKKFRTYSFRRYKKDQKVLRKLIQEILKKWFLKNKNVNFSVDEFIAQGPSRNKKQKKLGLLQNIWTKFLEIQKKLTEKQKVALEAVYLEVPCMTFTEAAKREKISRDSFQDRIEGAIKKFKEHFPELLGLQNLEMNEKKISLKSDLLYNGLFRKSHAKQIHSLYRMDTLTQGKTEIAAREGPALPSKSSPLGLIVRAWAITSSPVPDIADTDYFLGLFPEGLRHRKVKK